MSFISFNLWIVLTYKYVTWHIYKRNFCNHWHFNAWSLETFCFKTSEILHWEEPYLSASQVGGSGIGRGDGGPWIVLTYKYVTWHIYISLTFHCWSFETFCLKKSEMWHWDEPHLGANQVGGSGIGKGGPWIVLTFKYVSNCCVAWHRQNRNYNKDCV